MSEKNRHIPIKCRGLREVHYSTLKPFQGGLKKMSPESADKLKSSILKWGWRFPVFVWRDGGTDWIHDGHGRLLVLQGLVDEGYEINKIPVVDIEAKDRKEAAELLLALNSRYQKITDEGLSEYMNMMDITPLDLDMIDLPDIDMGALEMDTEEADKVEPDEGVSRQCPECGYRW